MSENLRVCKKCLIREQSEEQFFENLQRYIDRLPEDERVSQNEYERRLRICSTCEYIINGMCKKCGCFTELRAVLRVRKCPDLPPRWLAEGGK